MKELHEDRALFGQLIQETARAQGIETLYVEKDYWITRSLSQLARSAYSENLVFKGGTSLSKAYGLTHRFSEDIDVAVEAYPNRWTHHVMIGAEDEIDGELLSWIVEAAAFAAYK